MARPDPRNQSRYWRAPGLAGLPGMDLLHADFTTHDYAPHVHDSLVVAVTEVGGSEFSSRGRTQIADTQALLVFNPSEPHSGRMAGSARWRYRSFYLPASASQEVLKALGIDQPAYFTANRVHDPELAARFLALHKALDHATYHATDHAPDHPGGAQPDPLRQCEGLVQAFGALVQRHGQAGRRVPKAPRDARVLAPVLALMRDGHDQPLTLAQLGAAADLTPFQLIGAFKRLIGLTPHAYLTQLRLRAALAAMRSGQPVAEAALASGFYDQSALHKHFKRSFGMTPLQYVSAVRAQF